MLNDGAPGTPSSSQTRSVSALLVGSTIRARTSFLNVSLPTVLNPSRAYASARTSHSTRDREPVTVGADRGEEEADVSASKSSSSWPFISAIRSRAIVTSTASSPSSWAEAKMLHDGLRAATRARDLHRRRSRPGAHLPHEQAHKSSPDSHDQCVLDAPRTPENQQSTGPNGRNPTEMTRSRS